MEQAYCNNEHPCICWFFQLISRSGDVLPIRKKQLTLRWVGRFHKRLFAPNNFAIFRCSQMVLLVFFLFQVDFLKMKTYGSFKHFLGCFLGNYLVPPLPNIYLSYCVLVWSHQFLWCVGSFRELLFCQRRFNPWISTWINPCELRSCIQPMKMSVADENGGTIIQVIYENTSSMDSISSHEIVG